MRELFFMEFGREDECSRIVRVINLLSLEIKCIIF